MAAFCGWQPDGILLWWHSDDSLLWVAVWWQLSVGGSLVAACCGWQCDGSLLWVWRFLSPGFGVFWLASNWPHYCSLQYTVYCYLLATVCCTALHYTLIVYYWIERDLTTVYYTVLHCTILYYSVLHCHALHCTLLHCTKLHCTALHCTALHITVICCIVLNCTALHCPELYWTVSWPWLWWVPEESLTHQAGNTHLQR